MPIYAYRCDACGFQKDVLQKLSEPALTRCPSCEAEAFAKQLSAPAFQLKGTGWYVTDFRDNGKKSDGKPNGAGNGSGGDGANGSNGTAGDSGKSETAATTSSESGTASTSTPASAGSSTSAANATA